MSNPFNVINQLNNAFVSPFDNRSSKTKGEIIGNEFSNITQSLPLVGSGIDIVDSSISSSISAFQNLLTNPMGAAEMALQGLKVRRVINNYFDGIDSLVKNGKLVSKGNAIVYHKGHGFTYDSQGHASPDTEGTTELGDKSRYPSYASMPDFFKTTIGTDFYWGIKLRKADKSFEDLPEPVFCDSSKRYSNKNGFYFEGWLPAQTYQFSDYVTSESEDIASVAFTLSLPSGYKLGNKFTTTLIETDIKNVSEWLEEYRAFTNPAPKITLPYKNCVYEMILYTYQPTGALIRKYPFYVIPDVTQSLEGENSMTPTNPSIQWVIVGKAVSSKQDDKTI